MFFESPERETRKRPAKKNNENKIKSTQTGKLRLRSHDIIPGTIDDDDIVEIIDSPSPSPPPSPAKKKPKKDASTFSKAVVIDDEDDFFNFDGKTRKPLQPKPLPMIKDFPPPLVKKKPVTKSTTKAAMSKRAVESESDDEVEIVLPEPKRQKSSKEVPPKSSKEVPEKPSKSSSKTSSKDEAKETAVSAQLMKAQSTKTIFNLKRKNATADEDFFSFGAKHAKKEIPLIAKQRNKNVEPASTVTSTSTSISATSSITNVSVSQSDENLDLEPGRDVFTAQWFTNSTIVCVKKEEESEQNEMPSINSLSESDMKSVMNEIHVNINELVVSELGGRKAFKKKINYTSQTNAKKQQLIDWDDVDLLYPSIH